MSWVVRVAVMTLVASYLALPMFLSPGHVDEGMTLDLVRQVAEGKRVFFDFIDVYGPIHYWPPALFYLMAGKHVWGVRVWVLLVKLAAVAMTYRLVVAVAERFEAWLAALWMTVLLGMPWQALQVAYAFLHCVPFVLAVQYVLVCEPFRSRRIDAAVAGCLTATVIFIKVSTGAFLLAGGILYCFCWSRPGRTDASASLSRPVRVGWAARLPWVAPVLAVGCGAVFLRFVWHKVDPLFYVYLDLPLVLAVSATLVHLRSEARESREAAARRVPFGLSYVGATAFASALFFLSYFGVEGGVRHVREQTILLSRMTYEHPVPPIGEPGLYRGFTEYYWMQYPWLLTLLFCVWGLVTGRGRGAAAFGARWKSLSGQAAGLWIFSTLGMFAMYSYGTEVHVLGAFLPTGASFFVLLSQIRRTAVSTWGSLAGALPGWLEPVLAGIVVAWLATVAFRPRLHAFAARTGSWSLSPNGGHSPADNRLAHLGFLETNRPGMRDLSDRMTDTDLDRAANAASMLVDELTEDEEEILTISKNELVPFHSFTRPVWGRYRLPVYQLRERVLDRATFDLLAPPGLLQGILQNPPRVALVDEGELPRVLEVFPELSRLGRRYRPVATFPTLVVLVRTDVALVENR